MLDWINEKPKNRQVSLRLGHFVKDMPDTVSIEEKFCSWCLYQHKGDWGYPFSVDGHIYNKKIVIELLKKYIFTNPNTLEAYIVGSVQRSRYFEEGRCFLEPKMQTFPINIVQSVVNNVSQNVSVESLNQRYLSGDTMIYVYDRQFCGTKQYVSSLKLVDKDGKESILEVSSELVRPNA